MNVKKRIKTFQGEVEPGNPSPECGHTSTKTIRCDVVKITTVANPLYNVTVLPKIIIVNNNET